MFARAAVGIGSCSGSIHFRNIPIVRYTTECSAVVNSFFNSMLGTRKLTPTSSTPMPPRLAMAFCSGSRLATLMRLSNGPVHRALRLSWNRTSTRIPSIEKCGYVTRTVTWLSLQVRMARWVRDSLSLALSPFPAQAQVNGDELNFPSPGVWDAQLKKSGDVTSLRRLFARQRGFERHGDVSAHPNRITSGLVVAAKPQETPQRRG